MRILHPSWVWLALVAAASSTHGQSVVTPTSVTLDASSEFYPLINLVNGSGLSETPTLTNFNTVTHAGSSADTAWVTDDPPPGGGDYYAEGNPIPTMTFSFDQTYEFTHVITWGYTIPGNDSKAITVEFSTDGGGTFPTSANIERDLVHAGTGITDLQSLGGAFNANAVRFQITDNFLEAGPGGDRAGLGEVRFLEGVTGFVNLEIDRGSGDVTLRNDSASAISVAGLGMTSAIGALDPASWLSVAENYDEGGSVSADEWVEVSATSSDLSEATLGTGTLGAGQIVPLGTGAWLPNPTEDVEFVYLDAITGETVSIDVNYVGADEPNVVGDFNYDGTVDEDDWPTYRNGYRKDLTGMSIAEGYLMGDLNGDGVNNAVDFGIFKAAYEFHNPGGSFADMIAGSAVPEPSTWALLLLGIALAGVLRIGRQAALTIVAASALAGFAATSQAALPTLVSNWTLDANATDSVGGHNGTATDVTFGSAGANSNTGTSGTFNGATSTIDVPFSPDLNPDSFTVAMWVLANTAGAPHQSVITSRDDFMVGVSTHGYIIYNAPSGNWEFWTGDGDPGWAALAGTPVTTAAWTHLAITYDGDLGMKSFYINGASVGSVTNQGYSPNGTVEMENLHIGSGDDPGTNFFFDGNIDDVGVFNGVLTQREIQYVADNGIAAFDLQRMELQVDTTNGITKLLNGAVASLDLDQYEILSPSGSLNLGNWDSIQDNGQLGLPQGNGTGNGWEELGAPTANFVGEAYLQASSPIGTSDIIDLGNLFNTAGSQDLEFYYRTSDGLIVEGVVNYVTSTDVDGDYNGDGTVNAADYALWRDTLGSTSNLAADGSGNGTVDPTDYNYWKQRFGNNSGSGTAAVPEPSSTLLVLFAGIGTASMALRRRTRRSYQLQTVRNVAILAVAWAVVGSAALATVTLDRDFTFGEDPLEGPSQGAAIGSNNTSPLAAGDSADSIGPSGAFLDLTQSGGPTYQNVGPSGLARPGAAGGEFGARFDGSDDLLSGVPLNRPDELASLPCCSGYPLNYNGIVGHGLQLWVYPDAAALGSSGSPTTFQSIVADTALSGGPAINEVGQWTQINSQHADGADGIAPVPATIEVAAGNTWYHVMHHHFPETGDTFFSVLYVDGVAVSANLDTIPTGGVTNFVGQVVVGAAEVANNGLSPVYSNHFTGVVDDLEMYVFGDNTAQGGQNYGTFDLFADNEWIRNAIENDPVLQGTLIPGDVNKDGSVNGDGTGPVGSDDVSAFIAGWGSQNVLPGAHSNAAVGDWLTWESGDLNHDGVTDFADWFILRANHPTPSGLNLAALLGGGESVPEPSSLAMAALAVAACLLARWRREHRLRPV